MTRPHLIIIAGPNGAGKSTLANEIVEKYGIKSFDFDKEYYNRWEKFGYDPAVQRGCKEYVSKMFENKSVQLSQKEIISVLNRITTHLMSSTMWIKPRRQGL